MDRTTASNSRFYVAKIKFFQAKTHINRDFLIEKVVFHFFNSNNTFVKPTNAQEFTTGS